MRHAHWGLLIAACSLAIIAASLAAKHMSLAAVGVACNGVVCLIEFARSVDSREEAT